MAGNLGKTRPGAGYTRGSYHNRRRQRHSPAPSRQERAEHAGRVEQVGIPRGPRQTHNYPSRAAAERAAAYERAHPVPVSSHLPHHATGGLDLGAVLGALSNLGGSPVGSTSNPAADIAEEEAKNLLDVASENFDTSKLRLPGQKPTAKQTQAALALSALTLGPGGGAADAIQASEKVAQEAEAASKLVEILKGGRVRGAIAKGAAKAEPEALTAARKAAAEKARAAVAKLPAPVRTAGKVAGRATALPFKRPFTAPLAIEAPGAVVHGDPSRFLNALEGHGALASIGNTLGSAVSSVVPSDAAQNLIKDAFNLPAVALPSVYLPLAGAVEASHGDSSRLEGLLDAYKETGLLPALFKGDAGAALKAIEAHPLYTALEAGGAAAIVGRGSGALVRGATKGRVGGTARPPVHIQGLEHYGNVNELLGRGRYSPDLIRQTAQRLYDARRRRKTGGDFATPRQAQRLVSKDLPDRYAYEREQLRRLGRQETVQAMHEARPKSSRFKTDKASADVVSLAVQRIIRHPETFHEDLRTYRAQLDKAAKSGELTKLEAQTNKATLGQIDRALHSGNPEEVVRAANHFIQLHGELVNNIVDQGLLDAEQAAKASVIPFARVHQGAGYKKGVGVVDAQGNPLSLEAITAEMKRHGVEPPGFLTHQPRTASARGAWYRAFFPERQSLSRKARTGAAIAHGTADTSYRALVEQAARSRSIVDATGGFDGLIRDYGVKAPPGVKDLNTAHDAIRNPDRYGWNPPPDVHLRPIRTAPFLALKRELVAAARHQDLLDPENAPKLQGLAEETLRQAEQPGPGPVAFVPDALYTRLLEHSRPSTSAAKAVQAGNTAFKGAVLSLSPSFYVGNLVDNYLRAALSGIGPSDIRLGRRITKELPAGPRESLTPGAMYGSFKRTQSYRDARQFQGTPLGGLARGLHALRETPGPKQAVSAFVHSRDFLMELNSRITERIPQLGAIGKEARRDLQARTGYWHHALMVSDGAFEDLVKGLRNTDRQIQFAKAVEQVFGKWGKDGPAARGTLASLVPFWQWARASSRFVFLTMPAHHPIKTGLIAAAAEMTEKERAQFGLDKYVADEPLPGFLQGNLPLGGGITRNLGKYTSFGVVGDYPEFLSRMFFAQGSTPLQALQGLDWKGDHLAKADGSPANELERTKLALLTGFEQFIPGINVLEAAANGELDKFNPLATESGSKLDYLRSLSRMQQINVPVKGSGGSGSSVGGADYGAISTGNSGSSVDYGAVSTGGR